MEVQQHVVERHGAGVAEAGRDAELHLAHDVRQRTIGGEQLDELVPPEARRSEVPAA
jgi:hypothetical protein